MRTCAAATVPRAAARTCGPALRPRCPALQLGHFLGQIDFIIQNSEKIYFLYMFDTKGGGGNSTTRFLGKYQKTRHVPKHVNDSQFWPQICEIFVIKLYYVNFWLLWNKTTLWSCCFLLALKTVCVTQSSHLHIDLTISNDLTISKFKNNSLFCLH